MFGWRKGHAVTRMVEEYLTKAEEALGLMVEGFEAYGEKGLGGDFDEYVDKTHRAESTCDDIRRRIEADMYERSLIPESRGDIMTLLERLDKIPNRAESVLFHIQMQFLRIPERYGDKFRQLVRVNRDASTHLFAAVRAVFADTEKVRGLIESVDKEESSSDRLERDVIRTLFADEALAPDQRILLKELALEIGRVANACENAGDWLGIVTVKRMV